MDTDDTRFVQSHNLAQMHGNRPSERTQVVTSGCGRPRWWWRRKRLTAVDVRATIAGSDAHLPDRRNARRRRGKEGMRVQEDTWQGIGAKGGKRCTPKQRQMPDGQGCGQTADLVDQRRCYEHIEHLPRPHLQTRTARTTRLR